MSTTQPNGEPADNLVFATILASDPELVRRMILGEMRDTASRLWNRLGADKSLPGHGAERKLYRHEEARIRSAMDDLNELVNLMGQVGWR